MFDLFRKALLQIDEMYRMVANRHEREPGFEKPVCEALRAGRPSDGRVESPIMLPAGMPFAAAPSAGCPMGNKCYRSVVSSPIGQALY